MTQATLILDGTAPLRGTVETGGDYIQFRTVGPMAFQPEPLLKGRIEIEGRTEKVMVKSVHPRTDSAAAEDGSQDGIELTLQRFAPLPG